MEVNSYFGNNMIISDLFFQAEDVYVGQVAQAEVVFNAPAPAEVVINDPAPAEVVINDSAPAEVVIDELAPAEVVINEPAIGQVDGSDDAIVDGENGVFTVNETQQEDDDDDDEDPLPRVIIRPSQRRDVPERQERSQRQNADDDDDLDELNDRPLTQPHPARHSGRRHLSQNTSDDDEEEVPPRKRANLGFSHFFSSCREFTFTNCKFSF